MPKNEKSRLNDLKRYKVLDTPPEFHFDELTKLASLICDTPIALISLVDEERQWFKSKVGLEVNETPRDVSFCSHAIEQDKEFIVEDALNDARFKDNPLVLEEPKIRFYAGIPLKSSNGYNIGTLCVIDKKERKLDERQIEILKSLSKQAMNYIEMYKKIFEMLHVKNSLIQAERINSALNLAAGISHEINNPLAIMLGKLEILKERVNEDEVIEKEELLKDFSSIANAGTRITKIVKGLRMFSQCDENEAFGKAKFSEIWESILMICEKRIKDKGIDLKIDEYPNILIHCKFINICHAIYNIIINAFDSIKHLDTKWIHIKFIEDLKNNNINIRIIDSGNGIPPNIKEKMMEPFFSTKEINVSKGLGLSIARGIFEENKGKLNYDEKCQNTCFVITLPFIKK
ncbi:GAF domain-containing sensor histidine kinase [Silvanigrella aquatica]|uniref:histidine kinase n=1 Tax=Silvanigrella aquatica TaxID=1915309 RepID=A0A1L4CYV0_9BACT|nr:GAF domain-containing sensor histidine kinase [Silvanigrella aquatica]APJ03122.1 hypothetical protein AXG55_04050 [Silvanigrella aquatica]